MTFEELEKRLKAENLLQIHDNGSWKKYIGLKENRNFSYEQSYGIEKMEDGSFTVFIGGEQDDRGGFVYYWVNFPTIEEACDDLYDEVSLLNAIYKEKSI